MHASKSVRVMDADAIARALTRIAHEILERNAGAEGLALVGIRNRGVPLAQRIAKLLEKLSGRSLDTGVLDINLYRDDLSLIAEHPILRKTEIPFDVDRSKILLIDDVLFTGRTVRGALNGLIDLGRPDWIQLVVLVDRGHREVPIRADFVGKNIPTSRDEQVEVRLKETDSADEVLLRGESSGRSRGREKGQDR